MKHYCLLILAWMTLSQLDAQYAQEDFSFEQGQVMDIFFLRGMPDINRDSLFANYREKLSSVAKEYSYEMLQYYRIKSTLQGGSQPTLMILARWDDLQKRFQFMDDIIKLQPRFHEMRRELYSRFDLTIYEVDQDITFSLKSDRYNVATAIWHDCNESIINEWTESIEQIGAEVLLDLTEGMSPMGYRYNPDLFILSEWSSEASYKRYAKELQLPNCVSNINEFQF